MCERPGITVSVRRLFRSRRVRAHKPPVPSHCSCDHPILRQHRHKAGFDRRSIPPQIRRHRLIQKQVRWPTPSNGLPQSQLLPRHALGVRSLCIRLGLAVLPACTRLATYPGMCAVQPLECTPDRHPVLSVRTCGFLGCGNDRQLEYVSSQSRIGSGLKRSPAYYRYLNAHGKNTASTVFLFVGKSPVCIAERLIEDRLVVAIMDAGRNALSFFMLLVVSLGLSVVRESIGTKMFKCQALTGAHFVFGGNFLFTSGLMSDLTAE